MKKIYALLFALVTVFTAQADVVVTYLGTEVNDGDVLTLPMTEMALMPGVYMVEPDRNTWKGYDPYVTNNTNTTAFVMVKAELQGDYKPWTICGLKLGTCVTMQENSYTVSCSLEAGHSESFQIHCPSFKNEETQKYEYGTYDIKCYVNTGIKDLSFTLHYVYENTSGIDNASIDGTQVSYNAGALDFSFLTPATRTLEVYGLNGKLLRKAAVGQTGSMSLKDMPAGTYVYRVVENGHKLIANKFIVK